MGRRKHTLADRSAQARGTMEGRPLSRKPALGREFDFADRKNVIEL